MAKVVQWYVDNITNPDSGIEFSNYFPWKKMENAGLQSVLDNLHTEKGEYDFGRYTFRSDEIYHSWRNYTDDTEIRFIRSKKDSVYLVGNINIFPIRFLANEDQVFANPDLCPFENLPDDILQWLRDHPSCTIVFHDPHEAKAITNELFTTIPALIVKRKHYKLHNQFVFLDSRANPEVLIEHSDYPIPSWLHFAGANHWVQFVAHHKENKYVEIIKRKSKRTPLFDRGRFVAYAGRWRPTRYYIVNELLRSLPKEQLWLSLADKIDVKVPIEEAVRDLIEYNKYENKKRDIRDPFNEGDSKNFINLYKQAPINTFPESLREEGENYHSYEYFWLPNPYHYSRAFIDVSCETYNERMGRHNDDIFLTEKICKPLWAARPFICSANPGTYEELKHMGFKTFDKWWDESFAEEKDNKLHTKKLLDTIKYISSLSNDQCREMFYDMSDVLRHNQQTIEYITYKAPRLWIQEIKKLRNRGLI